MREAPANAPALGPLLRIVVDQRFRYLVVGVFNTLLGWGLFAVAHYLVGDHLGRFGYMVSLYLSYAVGVVVAFLMHRRIVFRVHGRFWLDLGRFTLVNLGGLGLNTVLLPLTIELTGLNPVIAQGCVALAVAMLTYIGHKWFSFRRRQ